MTDSLEPDAMKVARPVLRGEGNGDVLSPTRQLMYPSVCPLLHSSLSPASIAALSGRSPSANRRRLGISPALAATIHVSNPVSLPCSGNRREVACQRVCGSDRSIHFAQINDQGPMLRSRPLGALQEAHCYLPWRWHRVARASFAIDARALANGSRSGARKRITFVYEDR